MYKCKQSIFIVIWWLLTLSFCQKSKDIPERPDNIDPEYGIWKLSIESLKYVKSLFLYLKERPSDLVTKLTFFIPIFTCNPTFVL